jgi:DNA gyrase subunit A
MGRTARGVRGMRLQSNQSIIALIKTELEHSILFATANGYGKRTKVEEFSVQGRGGQGVIGIQTSERNGQVIGAVQVKGNEEILLISNGGTMVRTPVDQISLVGRNTQGVTLINLTKDEKLCGIQRVEEVDEADLAEVVPDGSEVLDGLDGSNVLDGSAAPDASGTSDASDASDD